MKRRMSCGYLLTACLFVRVAASAAELTEPTETIPWRPHFGRGVWRVEGGMALVPIFSLGPKQRQLTIEAEAASAVLCHPDGGVRKAQGAGEDRVALSAKHVEVFVDVAGTETSDVSSIRCRGRC